MQPGKPKAGGASLLRDGYQEPDENQFQLFSAINIVCIYA